MFVWNALLWFEHLFTIAHVASVVLDRWKPFKFVFFLFDFFDNTNISMSFFLILLFLWMWIFKELNHKRQPVKRWKITDAVGLAAKWLEAHQCSIRCCMCVAIDEVSFDLISITMKERNLRLKKLIILTIFNKPDYDQWAALGNTGWSYEEILPYFRKSEDQRNPYLAKNTRYHGTGMQTHYMNENIYLKAGWTNLK